MSIVPIMRLRRDSVLSIKIHCPFLARMVFVSTLSPQLSSNEPNPISAADTMAPIFGSFATIPAMNFWMRGRANLYLVAPFRNAIGMLFHIFLHMLGSWLFRVVR